MNPATTPLRCVIYSRVSTEEQDREGTSLDTQADACRAFAAQRGWALVAEPFLEVGSGFTRKRPKLELVREMVRSGQVDVILCYALDRLSRRQVDVAIVADECAERGALLAFATESFEQTAIGEFLRSAKAFAAELEREKIRERTQRGLQARVAGTEHVAGMPLPARRPLYGYVWADAKKSRLVIHEPTAEIVRRIFREIAAGATLGTVAARLTAEAVPTATGRSPRWTRSTVACMLKEPAYVGQYRAYRYYVSEQIGTRIDKRGQKVRRSLQRPDEETVSLPHVAPALVDRATFDTAQTHLARNRAESGARRPYDPESALLRGGFAVCGHCGGNMSATDKRDKIVYRCSRQVRKDTTCPSVTIRAEVLDRIVWGRVARALWNPDQLWRDAERLRENDPTGDELARLGKLIANVERSQRNVAQAIAMLDGNPDGIAPLVAQLDALAAQRKQLLTDQAETEGRRVGWEAARERFDALGSHLQTMMRVRGNPDEYDFATKRAALDWLGVKVHVYRTYPERGKGRPPIYRVGSDQAPPPAFVVTGRVPLDGCPPDWRAPDGLPRIAPGVTVSVIGSASTACHTSARPGSSG